MKQLYQGSSSTASPLGGRPIGVLLIAGLCFVAAVTVVVNLVALLITPDINLAGADGWAALLSVVLAPFFALTGYGLLRLKRWGLYLAVGFLGLAMVSFFVDALMRYPINAALLLAVSRSIIPGTLMFYLVHPSIRPAFRPHPAAGRD